MKNVEVINSVGLYNDVKDYVVNNYCIDENNVEEVNDFINSMSRTDILNAFLCWRGIIGYTSTIVTLVTAMFPDNNDIEEVDFEMYNCENEEV